MTWTTADIPSQRGRSALVTGANSGLGLVVARELARQGARVILACRNAERADDARAHIADAIPEAEVATVALDLASLSSVQACAAQVMQDHDHLDLLINNAGVMVPPAQTTEDGFELQFGVNHLGHFALTARLLPLLQRADGARIVTVSSQAHRNGHIDLADPNFRTRRYRAFPAYAQSKLANLLFTFELQRRLEGAASTLAALAAHPGWTATQLQQHMAPARILNPLLAMNVDKGALPILRAAVDPQARGGEYYGPRGLYEMWGYPRLVQATARARDRELASRLWDLSCAATGVSWDALGKRET